MLKLKFCEIKLKNYNNLFWEIVAIKISNSSLIASSKWNLVFVDNQFIIVKGSQKSSIDHKRSA